MLSLRTVGLDLSFCIGTIVLVQTPLWSFWAKLIKDFWTLGSLANYSLSQSNARPPYSIESMLEDKFWTPRKDFGMIQPSLLKISRLFLVASCMEVAISHQVGGTISIIFLNVRILSANFTWLITRKSHEIVPNKVSFQIKWCTWCMIWNALINLLKVSLFHIISRVSTRKFLLGGCTP